MLISDEIRKLKIHTPTNPAIKMRERIMESSLLYPFESWKFKSMDPDPNPNRNPLGFVMEASEGEPGKEHLRSVVEWARCLARPAISKFEVAAVGVAASGKMYVGVNIEFPGVPLHQSIHAEQFLLTNLSLNGEPSLSYFAVSAAPCGHCRQFIQELRHAPDIHLLITSLNTDQFTPLSHFLPNQFGPHNLLPPHSPLFLEPHNNRLLLKATSNGVVSRFHEKLKALAFDAANASHAPYSGSPSGVALVDSAGKVYRGSYVESAAFNPSLGPVQAALVAFIAGGGGGYEEIVGAVLVEKDGAMVKQEDTARMLLRAVSPHCIFETFLCCSSSDECSARTNALT